MAAAIFLVDVGTYCMIQYHLLLCFPRNYSICQLPVDHRKLGDGRIPGQNMQPEQSEQTTGNQPRGSVQFVTKLKEQP